jgi:hypothetical protein
VKDDDQASVDDASGAVRAYLFEKRDGSKEGYRSAGIMTEHYNAC